MPVRTYVLCFATAACFALGGCAADSNDNGDTSMANPNTIFVLPDANGEATGASATLFDEAGMQVAAIDTTHIVGGTSCPQNLGRIQLDNAAATGDMVVTLALVDPSVALTLGSTEETLAPGSSTEVAVEFTCASTDDISTEITMNIEFGGRVGVFALPVALDVADQ